MIETLALMAAAPHPSHGCAPGTCRFSTIQVKAFIHAYRDAVRHHDDPAEYIRDAVRSSRPTCPPCHKPDPIEPLIRGKHREPDDDWHILTKVAMDEAVRAGISMDPWNADRMAAWLCENDA